MTADRNTDHAAIVRKALETGRNFAAHPVHHGYRADSFDHSFAALSAIEQELAEWKMAAGAEADGLDEFQRRAWAAEARITELEAELAGKEGT